MWCRSYTTYQTLISFVTQRKPHEGNILILFFIYFAFIKESKISMLTDTILFIWLTCTNNDDLNDNDNNWQATLFLKWSSNN